MSAVPNKFYLNLDKYLQTKFNSL